MKVSLFALAVALTSGSIAAMPALATPGNNGGGNGGCGVGQQTNGCGTTNNGGNGGAGGSAIQGQAQGQIQGQVQGQGQVQSLRNQIYNGGNNGGNASAAGGNSNATANNGQSQGQSTSISNVGNTTYPAVASTATAPSYAIGQCQWAVSGGIQALGFGISGGGAGMYEFCKPLMKAKHFYDIGKPAVAKNLECNYSEFKEAYRMAGEPCRNDMSREELRAADTRATQALDQQASLPGNCRTVYLPTTSYVTCE